MDQIRPNALAIVRKDGLLLAAKGTDEATGFVFYRLMGGGIEFGELAIEALKRELKEELNATVIHERFLSVVENVFEFNSRKKHEITFLYEADLEEESIYRQERIAVLDKADFYAEWISIDDIKDGNIIVFPKETVDFL